MKTKTSIIPIIAVVALLVATMNMGTIQVARADDDAADTAMKNGETVNFDQHKDGSATFTTKHGDIVNTDKHGNTINSASASRADSASAAKSQNNVKCFAFCLGISNANSGSAANSDSRTNSPGNTAAALPVSPQVTVNPNEITPLNTEPKHHSHDHGGHGSGGGHHPITNNILADNGIINNTPDTAVVASAAGSGGTACFDNNGSVQDEGYSFGYFDSQHGKSIMSVKDHGNHTDEWRTGYNNGWNDGAEDLTQGVHRYPC